MVPGFSRLTLYEMLGILVTVALYGIATMGFWLANPQDPVTPTFIAELSTSLH